MHPRRHRPTAIVGILAAALLTGCSGLGVAQSFAPVGDFQTSVPKSRAEGGHTPPVVPPPGIIWTVGIDAIEESDAQGSTASHYAMRVRMVDRGTPPGTWRVAPAFEVAELVDDEGGRFRCTRALVPDIPPDRRVDPDEIPERAYTLVFDVPGSYRFRRISSLTVHWGFALEDGEPVRITTRFRGT